ncbi:hypothetical protein PC118_g16289 [Phytophthora cactorum]|nr:hypothetical protein PC118_g16289 [Phytophthora cactorum]
MDGALDAHHFDVVRFLIQHRPEKWSGRATRWAAENEDLQAIRVILKRNRDTPTAEAKVVAYKLKQKQMLRVLYEEGTDARPSYTLVHACADRDLEMVKYFTARGEGFVKSAMSEAIAAGALGIVKHLHENVSQRYTEASRVVPMQEAALKGQLKVLQYLNEHAPELSCTTKAMDDAAAGGYLDIIKYLHESREEGCTTRAMDRAATKGHLDVVKFLHENRQEGCTTHAMDYAALWGHLDIVRFLHENRQEGCTARAFNEAALRGHVQVVDILIQNRPESCNIALGIKLARQRKHQAVLKLLESYKPT